MQRFSGKTLPSGSEPRQDRRASWRSPLRDRDFLAHSLPEAAALWGLWNSVGSLLVIKVEPSPPHWELLHAPSLSSAGPVHDPLHVCALGTEGPHFLMSSGFFVTLLRRLIPFIVGGFQGNWSSIFPKTNVPTHVAVLPVRSPALTGATTASLPHTSWTLLPLPVHVAGVARRAGHPSSSCRCLTGWPSPSPGRRLRVLLPVLLSPLLGPLVGVSSTVGP